MTRLARRASLLVAFFLLTSAATADAECAWVFWQEATGPPTYESSTWTVSAWETKQTCEQALAKKVRSDSALTPGVKGEVIVDDMAGKPRVRWRTKTKDEAFITSYTYICLPDTIDPRGPKGQ